MVGARINLGASRKVRPQGVTAQQAREQDPQRMVEIAWHRLVRAAGRSVAAKSQWFDTGTEADRDRLTDRRDALWTAREALELAKEATA